MARTRTIVPAPKTKLADPRNEALQRMTKAELVRTVKTLDKRVTKLLNEVAQWRGKYERINAAGAINDGGTVWLRDVDGTGSLHPCAKFDAGAIAYVRAPDLTEKVLEDALAGLDAMRAAPITKPPAFPWE